MYISTAFTLRDFGLVSSHLAQLLLGTCLGTCQAALGSLENTVQKLQEVSSQVSYYYFVCHRGNLVFSNLCRFLESEVGDWLSDLDLLCLVWVIHFLYSIIGLRIRR